MKLIERDLYLDKLKNVMGTAYDYCGTGYYKSGVFATTNYDFSNNLQVITNVRPNR